MLYKYQTRKEVFPIQKEDLEKLREYFTKKQKVVVLALINIGVNVALRYSDLSRLRFEDIREDGSLSIIEQKTKKRRDLKFNQRCLQEVEGLRAFYQKKQICPTGYLFKSLFPLYIKEGEDHFLGLRSFNRYLSEAQKDLALPYSIGSHSLRKTWGYLYYKKTKDLGMIMKILNHSSIDSTLRYLGIYRENINFVFENFIL